PTRSLPPCTAPGIRRCSPPTGAASPALSSLGCPEPSREASPVVRIPAGRAGLSTARVPAAAENRSRKRPAGQIVYERRGRITWIELLVIYPSNRRGARLR